MVCAPVMRISVPKGALIGETGTHGVRACKLNSRACMRSCVVNRCTMMHACICDRGT
jgi:hypothetical protein